MYIGCVLKPNLKFSVGISPDDTILFVDPTYPIGYEILAQNSKCIPNEKPLYGAVDRGAFS